MTSGLLNTSDHRFDQIWEERQDALIASLQQQPLLLVVRPQQQDLDQGNIQPYMCCLHIASYEYLMDQL